LIRTYTWLARRNRRVTFLFSTHDPLIIAGARRRVYLADGRIVREERETLARA